MLGVHMWTGGGAGVGRATYGRVGAISGHRLAEGGRTQSGVERLHWRVGAVLSELSAQLSLPRGDGGKKGGRPEITHHYTITLTDEYSRQGVG